MNKNMITKDDYRIKFFETCLLGTELKNEEDLINRCIVLADKDMLAGGRFILDKDNHQYDVKNRRDNLYKKLKEYNYKYDRNMVNEIAEECFWKIDEERIAIIKNRDRIFKSYGLAAKFVNMTFKYMYVFKDYITTDIKFSQCDCPLDSNILETLGENVKWTNLKKEDYIRIQKDIDNDLSNKVELKKMRSEIGRMAYDYNWIVK